MSFLKVLSAVTSELSHAMREISPDMSLLGWEIAALRSQNDRDFLIPNLVFQLPASVFSLPASCFLLQEMYRRIEKTMCKDQFPND